MNNYPVNERLSPSPLLAPTCDDRLIWEISLSRYYLPTLAVANQIGLFRFLAQSPATVEDVAAGLSLGLRGAEVVLGLVCALGFLVQRQGRFHLTDEARTYLLVESPYYQGDMLSILDHPVTAAILREWLENDRATAQGGGQEGALIRAWISGEMSAETAEKVTAFVHAHSFPAAMGLARNGDFAGVHRLLDVAGGSGCFCIALATRYPHMWFAVMELPAVCKWVEQYVASYGLQGQIETVAANMFTDSWPSGYDGVLFSNIFHNWDRASCLRLAKRSFEMLPPGGRIFIYEVLLDDTKDGPLLAAAFSMDMFSLKGKQYTAGELDELLQEVGFTGVTVKPIYAYYSLVSASKPG
jgi:acetylserotonin N-methyltransferase